MELWTFGICSRGQEGKRHMGVCGVWEKFVVSLRGSVSSVERRNLSLTLTAWILQGLW